ncbi:protein kinase domain-containing protein [Piscirickettsia salmonis]|uniref:protein kinase domain-containing protein n=1 Tax=Piscirickettsia salmonis TaxID=1238 RepID=UPI0007C8FD8A|nr:Protein kinase domain protein [Piscirickettsiaceae bacterium NZ-RLO1]
MPQVIWQAQDGRSAEEQRYLEWKIAEHYLKDAAAGVQINPKSGNKKIAYKIPGTEESIYLTHRYLKGGEGEIFVKSNGDILGKGRFSQVTFGQTKNGRMWAIKESEKVPENSQESEIAVDLRQAKKGFKSQDKFYQVYQFLGTSLDHYLVKNSLTKELQYDLAIKMARAVYHLHAGTYSQQYEQYAHLDLKPANFCINDEGAVCLIDYRFSEQLLGQLAECKGSIDYLPDVWQGMDKEALDVLALLRSLYLPKYFKAVGEDRRRKCDT